MNWQHLPYDMTPSNAKARNGLAMSEFQRRNVRFQHYHFVPYATGSPLILLQS